MKQKENDGCPSYGSNIESSTLLLLLSMKDGTNAKWRPKLGATSFDPVTVGAAKPF